MISELTHSAWNVLEKYHQEHINKKISLEEAQRTAAATIKEIRYGNENKDYFWIIDSHPNMVMHPYRGELTNTDLSEYQDPNGVKLFIEAANIVKNNGNGYINYIWQWKDDSTRLVPKLSYVQGYKPWNWIIGTGIYIEDVHSEIRSMKIRLVRISVFITLLIVAIVLFVIRQSLNIENQRKDTESKLMLSRQKYKSLVEASNEGTLMILNKTIIFSNLKFGELIGYDATEVTKLGFQDIFTASWEEMVCSFNDPKKSIALETELKCSNGSLKEVILSASKVKHSEDSGYILIAKEISQKKIIERETELLSQELQTSLALMKQPIRCFIKEIVRCPLQASIRDAAILLSQNNSKVLFLHHNNELIGIINSNDLTKRVIAENLDTAKPVMEVMTSPIISIPENALLYEAVLLLKDKGISHLLVRNADLAPTGVISFEEISLMQQNSINFLIKEIDASVTVEQLKKAHERLPVLVNALIESGDSAKNITRIISSVSDAITQRIISLAIEVLGPAPCPFAFLVMGSEGRMEQTLATDQDNAIVYEPKQGQPESVLQEYFLKLGKTVCSNLNTVGYNFCEGNNMAMNPRWVQNLDTWKGYFSGWVNSSDPQAILDVSIFFDFRCAYGKTALCGMLRSHIFEAVNNKSVFYYHLAQSILKFKPPLGVFGKIIGQSDSGKDLTIDIKKIVLPIVGAARIYCLALGSGETNTLSRLIKINREEAIQKELYNELVLAYNSLTHLRLKNQARAIITNEPPNNLINLNSLTHIEMASLKKIFNEITNLQTKLSFDFKGGMD